MDGGPHLAEATENFTSTTLGIFRFHVNQSGPTFRKLLLDCRAVAGSELLLWMENLADASRLAVDLILSFVRPLT